jgi:hypothetical protein
MTPASIDARRSAVAVRAKAYLRARALSGLGALAFLPRCALLRTLGLRRLQARNVRCTERLSWA